MEFKPASKGFRSPLRNEWETYEPQMRAQQTRGGYEGTIARLMLDFMPVMVDAFERERDKGTPPREMLSAMSGIIMNLAEQSILLAVSNTSQRAALSIMLTRLDTEVSRRLDEPGQHGQILLPGLGG